MKYEEMRKEKRGGRERVARRQKRATEGRQIGKDVKRVEERLREGKSNKGI